MSTREPITDGESELEAHIPQLPFAFSGVNELCVLSTDARVFRQGKLQWLAGVTRLMMPFSFFLKSSIPFAYYFPDLL